MKLRVATWNMDHWKRTPSQRREAWKRVYDSDCDIALLQETVPPADVSRERFVWREIGRKITFGSAAVSLKGWPIEQISTAKSPYSFEALPLLGTFPGSVAVARVYPPDVPPITVVSLYAVIDVYSTTTLLRQLADLIPLFDSAHGDRIVLGGDLNISTQKTDRNLPRYEVIFALIESLGFVDLFRRVGDRPPPIGRGCRCGRADCYHVTTHRNAVGFDGPGWHLDYLFASRPLPDRCSRLWLDDDDSIWRLSDHCPVAVELDIEKATGPTPWDERYATEVADVLRSVLAEPFDWGIWSPARDRPTVKTDRSLTQWISAYSSGTLNDGRSAQIELGIWRAPDLTGHPLVAHAGLLGTPLAEKLTGIELIVPPDSLAKVVQGTYGSYFVVPSTPDTDCEKEIRAALDALLGFLRKARV